MTSMPNGMPALISPSAASFTPLLPVLSAVSSFSVSTFSNSLSLSLRRFIRFLFLIECFLIVTVYYQGLPLLCFRTSRYFAFALSFILCLLTFHSIIFFKFNIIISFQFFTPSLILTNFHLNSYQWCKLNYLQCSCMNDCLDKLLIYNLQHNHLSW